jgi:hypothetical protein
VAFGELLGDLGFGELELRELVLDPNELLKQTLGFKGQVD